MKIGKFATLFATLIFISGCSSTGNFKSNIASTDLVEANSTASLEVKSFNSSMIAVQFAARLKLYLEATGIFKNIEYKNDKSKYKLAIMLNDVKKVSMVTKMMVGALAGGDRVKATVTLTNRSTGKIIRSFKAQAEAAAHMYSDEHGIDAAFAQLEKQIALGLR